MSSHIDVHTPAGRAFENRVTSTFDLWHLISVSLDG